MNTLTGIEAERVSQILRHAIDRLHIMSYVPTHWDDDLATGTLDVKQFSSINDEILKMIAMLARYDKGRNVNEIL